MSKFTVSIKKMVKKNKKSKTLVVIITMLEFFEDLAAMIHGSNSMVFKGKGSMLEINS